MLYRTLGKTNEKVSILGFGCMRFQVLGGDKGHIDEDETIRQIRFAIDQGVNYIDTAYPYHKGMSEIVVGKALKDGYREKVKLATKLPSWLIRCREDMDKYLNEQLEKLDTDCIDFYLIHTLNKSFWENLKEYGLSEFLHGAKADGRIKHVGFSFHDVLPVFKKIVDEYDWEFCQIQYNFLDENYQAGTEGLKYAADKGLGVVVMEPLRGGVLAGNTPDDIAFIWNQSDIKRSSAEWALRFVWDHPEVSVVLSGMNQIKQIKENIESAEQAYPDSLTMGEKNLIDQVQDMYRKKMAVDCTQCRYCMPCPVGVDIPENFMHLNNAALFKDDFDDIKHLFNVYCGGQSHARNRVECGLCEPKCPQNIPIIKMLKEVVKTFEF